MISDIEAQHRAFLRIHLDAMPVLFTKNKKRCDYRAQVPPTVLSTFDVGKTYPALHAVIIIRLQCCCKIMISYQDDITTVKQN